MKMEHAWFLCTQSFQLARINTRLGFVFIGDDFYRRITPDLLGWLTSRIVAAIAAGRSPGLIEKSGDLLVEAVAQSGIEPSNELPEGYRPPQPWIPPSAVRAMSEAMKDYPLPTEGERND